MHISYVGLHLPQVLIRFGLSHENGLVRVQALQDLIREKSVTLPARGFCHMVFRQPVDQVDICSQQVTDACHLLHQEFAVVQQELKVKSGECTASPAGTRCLAISRQRLLSKCQVGLVDQFK